MPETPTRPLPQLTPANEFYWKSGADDHLRIQECTGCRELLHPPQPVCRHCHGTELGERVVSGRGIVAGFTVNQRFALPGLSPPYVVAQVALAEDSRIRLTTNIIDCEPEDVFLGMAVEVDFLNIEDVWLPLFRPSADQPSEPAELPDDEIDPTDFARHVRPMVTTEKFEDKVALTGVGMSQIGRRLMRPPLSLTIEACQAAVADAGLTMADIDGIATYPGGGNVGGFGEGGVTPVEAALGLRPTWHNGGIETFGPGGSVIAAMLAVAGGLARHVLCYRTVWESTYGELMKNGTIVQPSGRTSSWMVPFGATSAAHTLAQNAQRHFHRYGTTKETLGWIALNQRANAGLNPTAVYRDPMTMDDYLGARPITTPFGLYDCDVPCDGAVAVIVSAVETANDLARPPILVEAVGTQIIDRMDWDQSTLTHEPQVLGQAAHLWTRTSMTPEDVDVAELYDGFTVNCLSWIEGLGFCGIGESKEFLDGGKNISLQGQIPLNTHGGQLSHGRTHGMGLLHEAIVQLRGDGGDRQVTDARVGVVSTGGLTPSGVLLLRSAT
ncbi:thiolase C-terminal domain-containing protein [Gordonia sp. DT218]|uniref:thiolase C-terminal domain-containing protein n=1 Tax=unclassified Gordonia (in: high G+C Gram-positive bacteria) TaxID=2657482 RepID=UPI003CEAE90F